MLLADSSPATGSLCRRARPPESESRTPARDSVCDPTSLLVFHRDGIPNRRWRTAWRTACQATGVPIRFLHDCRRTAARNMIRVGRSVRKLSRAPSRRSAIVVEQAPESLPPPPQPAGLPRRAPLQDAIAPPLVGSLVMVMRHVFSQQVSAVALPQRHHPVQALLLDRPDEPFGLRVRILDSRQALLERPRRWITRSDSDKFVFVRLPSETASFSV